MVCGYCQVENSHYTELCPQKAADRRGATPRCRADFDRSGKVCKICHASTHNEEHHRLAAQDYSLSMPGGASGGEGQGGGRGKGGAKGGRRGKASRDSGGATPHVAAPGANGSENPGKCRYGKNVFGFIRRMVTNAASITRRRSSPKLTPSAKGIVL